MPSRRVGEPHDRASPRSRKESVCYARPFVLLPDPPGDVGRSAPACFPARRESARRSRRRRSRRCRLIAGVSSARGCVASSIRETRVFGILQRPVLRGRRAKARGLVAGENVAGDSEGGCRRSPESSSSRSGSRVAVEAGRPPSEFAWRQPWVAAGACPPERGRGAWCFARGAPAEALEDHAVELRRPRRARAPCHCRDPRTLHGLLRDDICHCASLGPTSIWMSSPRLDQAGVDHMLAGRNPQADRRRSASRPRSKKYAFVEVPRDASGSECQLGAGWCPSPAPRAFAFRDTILVRDNDPQVDLQPPRDEGLLPAASPSCPRASAVRVFQRPTASRGRLVEELEAQTGAQKMGSSMIGISAVHMLRRSRRSMTASIQRGLLEGSRLEGARAGACSSVAARRRPRSCSSRSLSGLPSDDRVAAGCPRRALGRNRGSPSRSHHRALLQERSESCSAATL